MWAKAWGLLSGKGFHVTLLRFRFGGPPRDQRPDAVKGRNKGGKGGTKR